MPAIRSDGSTHTTKTDPQPDTAGDQPPQTQSDHTDIPERPTVPPDAEIQTVKPVEQPSFEATPAMRGADDPTHHRVNIDPGTHVIGKLDPEDRQRRIAGT